MAIAFIGHSYMRRARDFVQKKGFHMGLQGLQEFYIVKGGMGVFHNDWSLFQHEIYETLAVCRNDLKLIVMDLSSNDVNNCDDVKDVARANIAFAKYLSFKYSCRVVVVQCIYRRRMLFPFSQSKTDLYNKFLLEFSSSLNSIFVLKMNELNREETNRNFLSMMESI